jgi:alpha-galactosidase/6-phospho-beta-glucosidase family protein
MILLCGHSYGRLVLEAIAALLSNRHSFECTTLVSVDVDSQDEETILKDASKYAQSIGVDGTIEYPPISDPGETSDID